MSCVMCAVLAAVLQPHHPVLAVSCASGCTCQQFGLDRAADAKMLQRLQYVVLHVPCCCAQMCPTGFVRNVDAACRPCER
jgi:hypothetical protein